MSWARLTLPRGRPDRPILWIVAGPNGSGKSSLYQDTEIEDFGRTVWIINPDLLTVRIRDVERCDLATANLEAVRRIETWIEASIRAYQTVGVETVLSTDKYRRLVRAARDRQFQVRLIYVLLDSVERNIERVKLRVAKGGHDVPKAASAIVMHARSRNCRGSSNRPIWPGSSTTPGRIRARSGGSKAARWCSIPMRCPKS